jgi:hypothetical protein
MVSPNLFEQFGYRDMFVWSMKDCRSLAILQPAPFEIGISDINQQ